MAAFILPFASEQATLETVGGKGASLARLARAGHAVPGGFLLTTAAYNTWATANNQPQYTTPAGTTIYNNIVSMVNAQKTTAGALPADFFRVSLGQNFYGKAANSYDITTLSGYKLYQLRTAYATNFGTLYNSSTPRYVQFGVKLYF